MSTRQSDVSSATEASPVPRLMSIDALRGFDMFWIVGGDDVARALGAWWGTPQGHRFAEQFEHVEWEGFRFYDLIFPLFLFLVGVVLPFSLKKYQAPDQPKRVSLRAHCAAGGSALPAWGWFTTTRCSSDLNPCDMRGSCSGSRSAMGSPR